MRNLPGPVARPADNLLAPLVAGPRAQRSPLVSPYVRASPVGGLFVIVISHLHVQTGDISGFVRGSHLQKSPPT